VTPPPIFKYDKKLKLLKQADFIYFLNSLNVHIEEFEEYLFDEFLNPFGEFDHDINIMLKSIY